MKRGGTLRRHKRINAVSDKVKAGKPEYDKVYADVDRRSGGRCEVVLPFKASGHDLDGRCLARAVDHHHTRLPRRSFHTVRHVMHICRRHHNDVTAEFENGRLMTDPNGDETFTCDYRFESENPFK